MISAYSLSLIEPARNNRPAMLGTSNISSVTDRFFDDPHQATQDNRLTEIFRRLRFLVFRFELFRLSIGRVCSEKNPVLVEMFSADTGWCRFSRFRFRWGRFRIFIATCLKDNFRSNCVLWVQKSGTAKMEN
mmetsp:Transcript_15524/g.23123  ORF Transcript_15524/g.23123 Transcript_15524/m.23123 type:complete len:132 (+) Transcript_15524:951-1346(+)